jgi:taurine transport system substrate-binding protein
MSFARKLSRREFGLLAGNVAMGSLAGGSLLAPRALVAQSLVANLSYYTSPNPQTYGKATGSFQKAFGDRAKANFVVVRSGGEVVSGLAGNSLDIAQTASSPVVVGYCNGVKASIIWIQKYITTSEGLVVRKAVGIKSLKDLAGRKVAVPFNTSVHLAMLAALESVGMAAKDVELVNMKIDAVVAAWKRKDIDAAYVWTPILTEVAGDGGEILFTSGQLQPLGTLIFDVVVATATFIKQHPDIVQAYLNECNRINNLYREQPQMVAEQFEKFLAISKDRILEYIAGFNTITPQVMVRKDWMGMPGDRDTGVLKTVKRQAKFLKDEGQVTSVPDSFAALVDASFVAKMV